MNICNAKCNDKYFKQAYKALEDYHHCLQRKNKFKVTMKATSRVSNLDLHLVPTLFQVRKYSA